MELWKLVLLIILLSIVIIAWTIWAVSIGRNIQNKEKGEEQNGSK